MLFPFQIDNKLSKMKVSARSINESSHSHRIEAVQKAGRVLERLSEGGNTYSSDILHVSDHVLVALALLSKSSIVDVVFTFPVRHDYYFD